MHWTRRLLVVLGAAVLALSSAQASQTQLDRAGLIRLADNYLAALAANDPSRVPLAPDVKFVENITRMKPGEGLWRSASGGPTEFKILVPDPVAQAVGFIVMMEETVDGKKRPIQVGGRLQVVDGRITEAEHVVVHSVRETSLKNLQKPRAALLADVPEPYRDARARLMEIGRRYYDALDLNNGRLAPFADDCVRFENGIQTSRNQIPADAIPGSSPSPFGTLGCEAQLDTQMFAYIDTIDNVRMIAADEQTGLAIGFSHFRHSMRQKEFRTFGVPGRETNVMNFEPFDLPAVHIYKIWGGQIHEVEAVGFTTAYMSPTGWE